MPVYIALSNLIIKKEAIHQKYQGGLSQYKEDFGYRDEENGQEDNMLIMDRKMNADEHKISKLMERGLSFDEEKQYSEDFVILVRHGGCLWDAPWLDENGFYAWHKDDDPELIKEAIRVEEEVTVGEIGEMLDKGLNPYAALK